MLKAILFDMDDTLLDWSKVTEDWFNFDINHLGYVFDYVCQHLYTLPDRKQFCETAQQFTFQRWNAAKSTLEAPQLGDVLVETCLKLGVPEELLDPKQLLVAYNWQPFPGVQPFSDVLEVLPDLSAKGLQLGIITNAYQPMEMRDRELEAFGLLPYLQGCRLSAADVGILKPHPAIFETALKMLNLPPSQVIFIGDSAEADIAGAQGAGMKAVLRTSAKHVPAMLSGGVIPDAEITTLHDLYGILNEWYDGWQDPSNHKEIN